MYAMSYSVIQKHEHKRKVDRSRGCGGNSDRSSSCGIFGATSGQGYRRGRSGWLVERGYRAPHAMVAMTPEKGAVFIRRLETHARSKDDAHQAMRMVRGDRGVLFQQRGSAGVGQATDSVAAVPAPRWVKLVRRGANFSAFDSMDGVTWDWLGTEKIEMPLGVFVGLAVTSHDPSRLCSSWGTRTFSTSGGPFSVTATYNTETSYAVRVTAVEAAALSQNLGTWWDDRDGNPNTDTYLVRHGPGVVTVTATPSPLISESELPSCWTFTGGDAVGSGKLQRTVDRTIPAKTVFTATAGSSTKQVTIIVYRATLGVRADQGNRFAIELGHSWWTIGLTADAKNVLRGTDAVYVDDAGYWPDFEWVVLVVSGPGKVDLGAQGHPTTGYWEVDTSIDRVLSAIQFTR